MTVYVDPLANNGWILRGYPTQNCHMFTDGDEAELHRIALVIGMKRRWYQTGASTPHYDLTPSRRALAVQAGAVELDRREAVEVRRRIRRTENHD